MTHVAISSWCEMLVWVLTHSLWQGALIAGAAWFALRCLPARRAERRYGVAVLGLAAVVVSSFATWSVLKLEPAAQPLSARDLGPNPHDTASDSLAKQIGAVPVREHSPSDDSRSADSGLAEAPTLDRTWPVWLAGLWLVGASVMLARTSAGVVQAQGLARVNSGSAAFDLSVLEGFSGELCQRLEIGRAHV